MTLADLHPVIQTTVLHLAHSNDWSLAKLGEHFGISKQAVHKRLAIGKPLLAKLLTESVEPPEAQKLLAAEREIERLRGLLKSLRMQLVHALFVENDLETLDEVVIGGGVRFWILHVPLIAFYDAIE